MKLQSLRTDGCIDEVIQKHSNMVYRLAYAKTKSKSDADDIFQEVFFRYIRRNPVFESEEHEKAWFIRVTLNCSKKLWSSPWFRKTTSLEDTLTFEVQEETGLHDALAELPQKYRIVIHLFYYGDLSIQQMSDIMGRKPSTIRTQLTRARVMLKERLKGELYDA